MNYYQKKLYLAKVNEKDEIIGRIERWQAHREKILHRGFTTILIYQNNFILQHRKHPVFDGVYDLSFSSHPFFIKNRLQSMEEAIVNTLKREWITSEKNIKPIFLEKYYYQEKDNQSEFYEHEFNYLYLVPLTQPIKNNNQFSYAMNVLTFEELLNQFQKINFAPWVKKIDLKKIYDKIRKYE